MKLKQLKRKHKFLTIALIAVAIVLVTLLSYYAVNGFSANDLFFNEHESVKLMVSKPSEGQSFYDGDSITVSGSMWGGIPNKVYVWDERYNVPIPCPVVASNFGVELYANDLSQGTHVLCFQGQATDGRWTPVQRISIEKVGSTQQSWIYMGGQKTFVETYFPQPLAIIFRPVEQILVQTVVLITGGTSEDDLNGDNIPDELQQSPVSPRHNPMNVPMSALIVYGLIIFVIIILILAIIKPYLEHRQKLEATPGYRQHQFKMRSLLNQKLRGELSKERARRKLLEKKMAEENKKVKKPINIYFSEPKPKNENPIRKME